MARNEEKALTLFNKWHTFKADFHSNKSNRRPLLASDCDSLVDAEKWRRDILQQLTKKMSAIKNASLGEQRLRELNDEINKLMRQRHYWDIRVRELGGTISLNKHFVDVDGKALPGAPGYKYYGAAKDLPGVRELFEEDDVNNARVEQQRKSHSQQNRRLRSEILSQITPEYYGFHDDGDSALETLERQREAEWLSETLRNEYTPYQQRQAEQMTTEEEKEYLLLQELAHSHKQEEQSTRLKELEDSERAKAQEAMLQKSKLDLLSKLQFVQ